MMSEKFTDRAPTPTEVKRSICRYLVIHAATTDLRPGFDLASLNLSNAPALTTTVTTTVTNKAGKVRTVRTTKPVKGAKAGLPDTALSSYFRTNQAQAATYAEMYKFIGQQLKVTEQ